MKVADPGFRNSLIACIAIGIFAVASWIPRMTGSIDLRWDGGAYYILGTSLAQGNGYRLASEPGTLLSSVHAPLLPAFVAAHQLLLGTSDPAVVGPALRFSTVLLSVAYAIAIFWFLRIHIARSLAMVAALIAVLQPQFVYFSDALYAETFFGLFTLLFFISQRNAQRIRYFLLAGVFAIVAYEARTAGIALFAAWIADTLLRRDFKGTAIATVMAAVPVLGWMAWISKVETSPDYKNPAYAYQTAPYVYYNVSYAKNIFTLKDPSNPQSGPLSSQALISRVTENLSALPFRVGEAVSTWTVPVYISLPLAFAVFLGLCLQVWRRQFLVPIYVFLSLLIVCSTPFSKQFVRYLLPLYPFFALALFQSLTLLAKVTVHQFPRTAVVSNRILIGGVIGAILIYEARDLGRLYRYHDAVYSQHEGVATQRLFYYSPIGTEFDEALGWINDHALRSDVIAATDPQWAYLKTQRKSVLPPFELNGQKAQQLVDTVPVKYLIAETKPQTLGLGAYYRYTSALLKGNPADWTLVWTSSNRNVEIYQRNSNRRIDP